MLATCTGTTTGGGGHDVFCYNSDHVLLRLTLKIIATAAAVFYDLHVELQAAPEVVIPLIDSDATIVAN